MRFVIGKEINYSLSPIIHKQFGDDFYYVKNLDEEGLKSFLQAKEFDGLNVTIPYKKDVIKYLDDIDNVAKIVGAVNTIKNLNGRLIGYNTDVDGMQYALKKAGIDLAGKNVLILGSGATSKTATYVSRCAKSVKIVSRNGDINYQNCYDYIDTQIVINTTPVGMKPNAFCAPIALDRFPHLEGVLDVNYNPFNTFLLQDAQKLGLKTASGLDMLVEQARVAHNIFLNDDISQGKNEQIVSLLKRQSCNIYLIGMGGSGKSTIAKSLASKLQMRYVDTDALIVEKEQKDIDILIKDEQSFRRVESEVLRSVCLDSGVVVATGGGIVLDEDNIKAMRTNGKIVLLDRSVPASRPLYRDENAWWSVKKERDKLYHNACDICIDNLEIDDCINQIVGWLA